MADEHDPKRHAIYRFEHAGIMSEPFATIEECAAAAKVKLLAYPKEPAIIFMSTQILTVENVTVRTLYPWYPPIDAAPPSTVPNAAGELAAPVIDDNGLEII